MTRWRFQQFNSPRTLHNEPIYEGDESWPDAGNGYVANTVPSSSSLQFNHLMEGNKENGLATANGFANQAWQESPIKYAQPLYTDTSNYA